MKDIVFSVIMPCYNSEKYVVNAIESLLNQTYPHWELVAINDGSIDRTLDILEAYAKNDSRIKIFCKENEGYVSAVNMGLEHVGGDYFLMMGSDDALEPNLFEELAMNIKDELPDAIAFKTIKIKNGENVGIDSNTLFDTQCIELNTTLFDFSQKFPQHAAIFFARDTSKCFKTEKLGILRYFGKYGVDADGIFSMLFCHQADSFLAVPVIGYRWTLRGDSLSANASSYTLEKQLDRIENWSLFFKELLLLDRITAQEQGYLHYFLNIIYEVLKNYKKLTVHYSTIRESIRTIKKVAKKFKIQDSLPRHFFILGSFPRLYSLILKARQRG